MPPSKLEKALMGVGGVIGAGILAWQTQFPWIKYDLQLMKAQMKITKAREKASDTFLIDCFEEHVHRHPQKTMVIYEDGMYTYEFMDQQANRVASVMRHFGLKCGDTVAMMIHSEPAFIWTLLGLQKLGVAVALINYNLRLKHLSHSILATDPLLLIVGAGQDLQQAVGNVHQDLGHLPVYVQGVAVGQEVPWNMHNFDALMLQSMPVRPDHSVREGMMADSIITYIYTSGTTGLPKPAFISQRRAYVTGLGLIFVGADKNDILYTCLPLYHSAGGGIGLYNLLQKAGGAMKAVVGVVATCCCAVSAVVDVLAPGCAGGTGRALAGVVVACCAGREGGAIVMVGVWGMSLFGCTTAGSPGVRVSLGLAAMASLAFNHELDSVHKVRGALGNGLRRDIFEQVQKRFQIPQLCEFFGATEGVSALFNIANRPGAIGRVSPFMEIIEPDPKMLVKYDLATAMPIRDSNGHCIKIKPGEAGLFIAKVPDMVVKNGTLSVYKSSQEANEKKLIRNAFKDGDLYFNFGDVLYLDKDYFVYFHDRIGDTFRWKGENVSTNDVANALTSLDFILDANVYGVTVPGHDGRAGMAALSLTNAGRLSPDQLRKIFTLCQQDLPVYAWPLFLRVLPEEVLTGTYKQRKVELREEGYDLSKVKDDLYYLDTKAATYSPLTPEGLTTFLHSRL